MTPASPAETADRQAVNLAIGRIFRLASRPAQPGDVADYERCRAVILAIVATPPSAYVPNWARERLQGAQGG